MGRHTDCLSDRGSLETTKQFFNELVRIPVISNDKERSKSTNRYIFYPPKNATPLWFLMEEGWLYISP